jgi:hypothetical protein
MGDPLDCIPYSIAVLKCDVPKTPHAGGASLSPPRGGDISSAICLERPFQLSKQRGVFLKIRLPLRGFV